MSQSLPSEGSHVIRKRLWIQGYSNLEDSSFRRLKSINRFTFIASGIILGIAMANQSILILCVVLLLAILGAVTAHHPLDHAYSAIFKSKGGREAMIVRSSQNRFGFAIEAVWIALMIGFYLAGMEQLANLFGAVLLIHVLTSGLIDLSVPALIYNAFTGRKTQSYTDSRVKEILQEESPVDA